MENLQGGTLALEHFYHLDERLHAFGLVTVYAATQDPFDHPVQVVVYDGLADAGAAPGVAESIREAAPHASYLRGDGLLQVVDFGDIDQHVPFVIEQTRPGPTLTRRLQSREMLSPTEAADLVARLAEVLQKAHRHGVCHGNLKPDWIVFESPDAPLDTACLSHFGMTPSMRQLVAMPNTVLTTDLVDAFPPECFDVAARDDDELLEDDDTDRDDALHLTPRADQWALAALAFRLLAGVHPFFDDPVDASDGILRIKTEDPPSLTEMGVEPAIADVVDRGLAPDPQQRWPSIEAFARAFEEAVDGPPASDKPSSPDREAPPSDPPPQTRAGPNTFGDSDGSGAADAGSDWQPTPEKTGAEPTGPRPSGYLVTGAVVLLVLSNLGWFFVTMGQEDHEDQPEDEPTAQQHQPGEALPTGLAIDAQPDAELRFDDPGDDEPLRGPTPFTIPADTLKESPLQLTLHHDDYLDQPVSIDRDADGEFVVGVELIQPLEDP